MINAVPISVLGNGVIYNVTTNTAGTVYYSVQGGSSSTAVMTEPAIKTSVLAGNSQIGGASSMQTWVSIKDPYLKVGNSSINSGNNTISIGGLAAGATYTVCMYLENYIGAYSNATCSVINTTSNGAAKTTFTFNQTLTPTQRNNFLCQLSSISNANGDSVIVTMSGESCNRGGSVPRNYYYNYNGVTVRTSNQITTYIVPNNMNDIQTIANIMNLFQSQNVGASLTSGVVMGINSALGSGAILISSSYNGMLSPVELQYSQNYNVANAVTVVGSNSSAAGTISINISSSRSVIIYVVVISANDPAPTAEQVINCRNGQNNSVFNCSRIEFINSGVNIYVI